MTKNNRSANTAPFGLGRCSLLAATLGLLCAQAVFAGPPADAAPAWAPGRILLMPRAGLSQRELDGIVATHRGKSRRIGQSGLYIVDLPPGLEKAAAEALTHHPHIKFAELDRRIAPGFVPNDPYAGSEWHLSRIGAPAAWDTAQGAGVTIAILDSGVDGTHPDLASQMVPGWNFYDGTSDTSDVNGHGTAVAGAAAASSNNGLGVAAVAGRARIMPVRIADANAYAYWSTVAQGLTYAADHGARVANISYVGVAGSASVQSAAQYMKGKGGLVLVCAGNNGIEESIAPTTAMIPVSATDANDALASWSSYGQFVAMSAPGLSIWTTARGGAYQAWSGTSLASPITAGVVALMMSARPALANTQVESLLYSTATDLGAAGRDRYFGYGRVDAVAAVQAAAAATSGADTQPPAISIGRPAADATVAGLVAVDVSASDNVGVTKVELRVNGTTVANDASTPFGFSWDSTRIANGAASLVAYAFDAAGNAAASAAVSVNVANTAAASGIDTTPPVIAITSPSAGTVKGTVTVTARASDNAGAAGITQSLYIDGALKASASGATLKFGWNTRKYSTGTHILRLVGRDAAGNTSSATVQIEI